MQARRAARELALILFSQLNDKIKKCNSDNYSELVLKAVRILASNSDDELKIALTSLMNIKSSILAYQANDETNLNRPIGASDIPVKLPMTNEILEDIENIFDVSDKAFMALSISELAVLSESVETKNYTIELVNKVNENIKNIDEQIQKYSSGWDISRIFKIDKYILRIAIAELLYIDEVPFKVAVDEAVELTKKYSTDESFSFINGVLSKVILENGVK